MKADDFLGQYQIMEPCGVASAEEVEVENLADHLRIEITAAGTLCATPCCGRSSCCSTSHRSVSPRWLCKRSTNCSPVRGWRHLREPGARAYDRCDIGGLILGIQEINDRTNDSSPVSFQAPLHQVFKGNPVKT
jgi:hypothetical protein